MHLDVHLDFGSWPLDAGERMRTLGPPLERLGPVSIAHRFKVVRYCGIRSCGFPFTVSSRRHGALDNDGSVLEGVGGPSRPF